MASKRVNLAGTVWLWCPVNHFDHHDWLIVHLIDLHEAPSTATFIKILVNHFGSEVSDITTRVTFIIYLNENATDFGVGLLANLFGSHQTGNRGSRNLNSRDVKQL